MKLRHLTLLLALSPMVALGNPATSAERISEANFNYCMQEILAEEEFCRCTSDIYKKAVENSDLTEPEVDLMVRAFSGQLALDEFSDEDFAISESLSDKINMEEHEDEFMQCATYIEADENTDLESIDQESSDAQEEAIREAEEIEALEDLDIEDDLSENEPLNLEDLSEDLDQEQSSNEKAKNKEETDKVVEEIQEDNLETTEADAKAANGSKKEELLKEKTADKTKSDTEKALDELKAGAKAAQKDLEKASEDLKKIGENVKALDFTPKD